MIDAKDVLRGPPLPAPRFATLQQALAAAAQSRTGLTFLDAREEETALPFAELYGRARQMAAALCELGIEPGDRVAIILPTGRDFMDAFFGALLARAVPVPLYPPVRLGRLEEFHERTARALQIAGARLVLSDALVSRLLGVAVSRARPAFGHRLVAELLRGGGGELALEGAPGELALIQFSSGSTVEPKPVALTHANVLANLAAIDTFLPEDLAIPQSGVSWLPLYHDMGLIGCLLLAVVHPGNLTLLPPELFLARPALWLRAISRKRATISVAPNFAFGLALKRIGDHELEGVDLSCLKLALNGAEPIAPGVLRRFGERFARFGFDPRALTPVYGLSEATLAVTFSSRHGAARTARVGGRELVSVGAPLPGLEVRIDRAGQHGEGRILVRGPSVMRGYLGNAAATAAVLQDGWLDTGDLGLIEGGELFISGRAKDLVILRGKNHAPQEFEDALDGLDGVRAGCAVAVGLLVEGGEELALLVEGTADPEAVRSRVVERTGIRAHTVRMLPPGTLPRTSSGKLRRSEAQRQLLADELAPPAAVTPLGIAKEAVRSLAGFAKLWLARGQGR